MYVHIYYLRVRLFLHCIAMGDEITKLITSSSATKHIVTHDDDALCSLERKFIFCFNDTLIIISVDPFERKLIVLACEKYKQIFVFKYS